MNNQLSGRSCEIPVKKIVTYFGLPVQVICPMPHYSLIRYRGREFVVNTEDLRSEWSFKCAA